jgi:DNA-directed RNA polymerase specialized sigma24 family protein
MHADAAAIERVYRTRYVGFRNALATVTGSQESARDAVQEGFARALARHDQFQGGSLEAWIWRTALRCALDARRAERRLSLGELIDSLDPQLLEPERSTAARHRLVTFRTVTSSVTDLSLRSRGGVPVG